jgi:hypothetical protein
MSYGNRNVPAFSAIEMSAGSFNTHKKAVFSFVASLVAKREL